MQMSRRSQWATEGNRKTEVAVTDQRVRASIVTTMRRLGVQVNFKATHLGAPFRLGAKTRTPPGKLIKVGCGSQALRDVEP